MENFEVSVQHVNSGEENKRMAIVTVVEFGPAPKELLDKTASIIVRKVQATGVGKTAESAEDKALSRALNKLSKLK